MIQNRFLYTIIGLAIVVIGFCLWKMSPKDVPEVKKIYKTTTPTRSTRSTSETKTADANRSEPEQIEKAETDPPDFVDKDGDGEITILDVMDPNLPISHPRNVEARHKLSVAQLKSWKTPEELANPNTKRYFELVESEEYLELVKRGANVDELSNFLADNGLNVTRNPMQVRFREVFPIGEPSDYEPEMRAKLSILIAERGEYNSKVLSDFLEDERAQTWYGSYFGPHINQRDMNLDPIVNWIKDVRENAMHPTTETPVPDFVETPPVFEERASVPSVNTTPDSQTPQELFTREAGNTPKKIETKQFSQSDFELPDFELPMSKNFEKTLRERLSPQRFNTTMETLIHYGPKEGIRRLKESDPEIAKQIEQILEKHQENNK